MTLSKDKTELVSLTIPITQIIKASEIKHTVGININNFISLSPALNVPMAILLYS